MGSIISPFRFIHVGDANTTSTDFVDLLVVSDVLVSKAGNILAHFDVSIEMTPGPGEFSYKGAALQFTWDNVALGSAAFFELDPAATTTVFDTFSSNLTLRELIAATVGTHRLAVQWQSLNVIDTLTTFANSGSLTIQGV